MRKTRVQNDQFWDHLNDNVDDYVQRKGGSKSPKEKNDFGATGLNQANDSKYLNS